jgi:hypothetical protein
VRLGPGEAEDASSRREERDSAYPNVAASSPSVSNHRHGVIFCIASSFLVAVVGASIALDDRGDENSSLV